MLVFLVPTVGAKVGVRLAALNIGCRLSAVGSPQGITTSLCLTGGLGRVVSTQVFGHDLRRAEPFSLPRGRSRPPLAAERGQAF